MMWTMRLRTQLLLAVPIFVAHFLEEAPTFVAWFNAHVSRGIDSTAFWTVNLTGLAITVAVVAFEWLSETPVSTAIAVAWLGLLMFTNAVFHVVAAVADRGYVPGVITAVVLYLPFFFWFVVSVVRSKRLTPGVVVAATILGGIPMAVHGYLIIFRGSRLF